MKLKLFNQYVELNDYYCHFNDTAGRKVEEPYINLYVRLTDACNAKCKFCEFNGDDVTGFDKYKLYYILYTLSKQVRINKVSFTGGEPTLKLNLLNECLKTTKEIDPNIFTVVNTNGYRLDKVKFDYVDSIALSLHSIKFEDNYEIFGTEQFAPDYSIECFKYKEKLHLSCNLIKGYIDSKEKAYEYINHYGNLGVTDIGFVSLMDVNQYCKDKMIDFDDIKLDEMPNTIKNMHWSKRDKDRTLCKCDNFLTYTDQGNIVKSYARYYIDREQCKSMIVYDIDRLKVGFNGKILI